MTECGGGESKQKHMHRIKRSVLHSRGVNRHAYLYQSVQLYIHMERERREWRIPVR